MVLTKQRKEEIINKFGLKSGDTGSPEVQIALISERIKGLAEHFARHKRDYSSRRGLLKLVGQRRRLLNYLKSKDIKRYKDLIAKLDLRK